MTIPVETIWAAVVALGGAVGFLFRRYDAAQTDRITEYREKLLPAVEKLADAFAEQTASVSKVLDMIEAGDRHRD